MHWDRQPCASCGQYGLLAVEVVRTWAYPSVGGELISISKLSSKPLTAVTYLLVFLILVVAALASSSEPRLLISLIKTVSIASSLRSERAYHLALGAVKALLSQV